MKYRTIPISLSNITLMKRPLELSYIEMSFFDFDNYDRRYYQFVQK